MNPRITDRGRAAIMTPYEFEVLREIAMGYSTKQACEHLGCANQTIAYHRLNIYRKTGYHSPAELCRFAIRTGLIEA